MASRQQAKAAQFAALHVPGDPVLLYNVWDASGAKTLTDAGAKAIATGSWSIAAAHDYQDGEQIPLDFALEIVRRIIQSTELPVTVDFEGGYAAQPDDLAGNVRRVIQAGAIGINFEDQVVGGDGLYAVREQSNRIQAVREAGKQEGIDLFINARTDLFLREGNANKHADLLSEVLERADAYRSAGANGFFVPGLTETNLIGRICEEVALPVNVMMMGGLDKLGQVRLLGVARASYGPRPYVESTTAFAERFKQALQD